MEFFQEVSANDLDVSHLKHLLTIKNLPVMCASINTVISEQGNEADIYCIWGNFNLRRDEIRYGIRFSLLNCPHALAWTITFDEERQNIVIHCTIIDKAEQEDFINSIHEFVTDWSVGITKALL